MIEIDVFFSFGVGAGFAAFAGDLLKYLPWDTNQYFMYMLLFHSLIFAPSGIYLLWAFPGWETMFLFTTKDEMRPLLPTLFCFSNIFLAILGFYFNQNLIKQGKASQAHAVWFYAYVIMFSVIGFGYRRFLYTQSGEEWSQDMQTNYHAPLENVIFDFFWSNILKTLVAMGVIILPALFGPQLKWYWRSGKKYSDQVRLWNELVSYWTTGLSLGSLGFVLYMFLLNDAVGRDYFKDGPLGYFTPLVSFYLSQFGLFILISILLLIPRPPAQIPAAR